MKNKAIHVYLKKGLYYIAILDERQDDYKITNKTFRLKRATRFWRTCDENTSGELIVRVNKQLIIVGGDSFESRIYKF
jgi:hypothetical protein